MKLFLQRKKSSQHSTLGELFVNGVFECYTLEDVVREKKIQGETAIPAGTYKIIVNESKRFKRELPLLLDVPNFDGIRIHTGNTCKDTLGCILVGKVFSVDIISQSKVAFEELFPKMKNAIHNGEEITIEIVNFVEKVLA